MRQVCLSAAVSLDGFITGPNGEIDWIVMDPDIDFEALFARYDTVLMGRKSYEEAQKLGGMPGLETIVFSRTLRQENCPGVTVSADPAATVADLKSKPGKDIWLFGGAEIYRQMFELGLVDWVQLAIEPVLLGRGLALAPETNVRTKLRLVSQRHYEKSGAMLLDYEVVR